MSNVFFNFIIFYKKPILYIFILCIWTNIPIYLWKIYHFTLILCFLTGETVYLPARKAVFQPYFVLKITLFI